MRVKSGFALATRITGILVSFWTGTRNPKGGYKAKAVSNDWRRDKIGGLPKWQLMACVIQPLIRN